MCRPAVVLVAAFVLAVSGCVSVYLPASVAELPEVADLEMVPSLSAGDILEVLHLDTRSPRPVSGDMILEHGRDYMVTVSGTYSVWMPRFWRRTCYGEPEPRAMYPSQELDGPVGLDAAFRFATPSHSCPERALTKRPGWLYRLRESDPWAAAHTYGPYSPTHEYRYRLRGEGEPLSVRMLDDVDYTDNYGRLRVVVQPVEP